MAEIVEDGALVLRKTPYSESSLIAALLTREHGQVHVLLKGARRTGKRVFPAIDLFREVSIQFQPAAQRDLHVLRGVDLRQAHDAIAERPAQYRLALWLSRFIIANTRAQVPQPRAYQALANAFARLAQPDANEDAILLGLCFTITDEAGVLPAYDDAKSQRHIAALQGYALDANCALPTYPPEIWAGLRRWMHGLLAASHFSLPQGLEWYVGD